jgi:outer membrane protein assembly factor BamE
MTRSQVRFLLGTPMVPDAFDDSRWDYYYFYNSRKFEQPLKRRLTVYFADERVQRVENQGVPTQTDLDQLEQDLQKAIAANKKNRKQSTWHRMFGHDKPAETTTDAPVSSSAPAVEKEAQKEPDPVPASQPLPVPSGTPLGQP